MRKRTAQYLFGIVCAVVAANHGAMAAGVSQAQSHGDTSSAASNGATVASRSRNDDQTRADHVVSYFLDNIDRLSADDTSNAQFCVQSVGRWGTLATAALPKLRAIISDTHYKRYSANVVAGAITSIAEIDPQDKQSLPLCLAFLNDLPDEPEVVNALRGYLSAYGPAAKAAIPKLLAILAKRSNAYMSGEVFNTLGGVHEKLTASSISALSAMLKSGSLPVVSAAIQELIRRGSDGDPALAELAHLYTRSAARPYVRGAVIEAFKSIGIGGSEAAANCLELALVDINLLVRRQAQQAMERLGSSDIMMASALDRIIESWADGTNKQKEYTWTDAAWKLRLLEPGDARSVDAVIQLLRKEFPRESQRRGEGEGRNNPLFMLLASIGPPAHKASGILLKYLRAAPDDDSIDPKLLIALARIGPPPESATDIAKLVESVSPDHWMLFDATMLAAASLPDPDPRIVALIEKSLLRKTQFGNDDHQYMYVDLERLGYGVSWANGLPSSFSIRMEALGKMGAVATSALPTLKAFASDPSPDLYKQSLAVAARQAILHITASDPTAAGPFDLESRNVDQGSTLQLGRPEAGIHFKDIDGVTHTLAEWHGHQVLFIFVSTHDGMFAYKDRLDRLRSRFSQDKLTTVYVYSEPQDTASHMKEYYRAWPQSWIRAIDTDGALKAQWGARLIDEAFLFDGEGALRYHGRIDDSVFDPYDVTEKSLENAIDDLNAGRAPRVAETTAIGCPIR